MYAEHPDLDVSVLAQARPPFCPTPEYAAGPRRCRWLRSARLSVVAETSRCDIWPLEVEKYLAGGVAARRGHHAAARVTARAAQIQAAERAAILCIAGNWAVEHELIHRQFAVEDVAFSDTDLFLDHCRRADLDMLDQALEVGAVFGDLIDNRLAELLSLLLRDWKSGGPGDPQGKPVRDRPLCHPPGQARCRRDGRGIDARDS